MTNWEKYAGKFNTTHFGLKNGEPVLCDDIKCKECDWYDSSDDWVTDTDCSKSQMRWLKSEYSDHKEKMHQAKIDMLNTLNSNILCDVYAFCTECPMYLLKAHKFDDSTCSTVVRAIISEGIKTVIEND